MNFWGADPKSPSRQEDVLEKLCEEETKKEAKEALQKLTALLENLPPREKKVFQAHLKNGFKKNRGKLICKTCEDNDNRRGVLVNFATSEDIYYMEGQMGMTLKRKEKGGLQKMKKGVMMMVVMMVVISGLMAATAEAACCTTESTDPVTWTTPFYFPCAGGGYCEGTLTNTRTARMILMVACTQCGECDSECEVPCCEYAGYKGTCQNLRIGAIMSFNTTHCDCYNDAYRAMDTALNLVHCATGDCSIN